MSAVLSEQRQTVRQELSATIGHVKLSRGNEVAKVTSA
jgi:hypothetical protein